MPGNPQQTVVQTCAICGARFQVYATMREALCPTCGATNQIGVRPQAKRPAATQMPVRRASARPIVVIQESSAQSWLVIVMLLIIAGLGGAVYVFRDRIWTKPEKPLTAPTEFAPPVDVERRYRVAQAELLDGDKEAARAAAKTFREIDGPGVAQPLRNWVTFHAGLAHLIAGEPEPAVDRFRKLGEQAGFSKQSADAKLAAFFAQSAALGSSAEPIPASAGEALDRKNFEAMGLLLYGLKNWALGKVEEASGFFAEFAKATPEGEDEWIDEYKPLARDLIDDHKQWRAASEAFAGAKDAPEKQATALVTIKEARQRLRSKQFTAEVAQMETQLAAVITAREAGRARMMSEAEAADTALIAELKTKTEALCQEFRFAEAQALVSGAKVTGEKQQEELKLLRRRMDSLARFQRNLAADLAALGYRGGITQRDGKVVPGDVRRADEKQIETVPWTEVAPEWLTKVASGFIDATSRLDYKSDRLFDLGMLLYQQGKKEEADAWMKKAGDLRWEYLETAMLLLGLPPEK